MRRRAKSSEDPSKSCHEGSPKPESFTELTAIEMIGINRPGLFSEISAVLAEENCSVLEAHAWSHNDCLACVAYVSDGSTSSRIDDPGRLATIEDHLSTVLQPATDHERHLGGVRVHLIGRDGSMSRTERRLHQLMLESRDFDSAQCTPRALAGAQGDEGKRRVVVTIDHCSERDYLVASIESADRPKLMFDVVCTLTDMRYAIFHAAIRSQGQLARQEYFIRRRDGCTRNTVEERRRISRCLEAAIERRVCEGLRLELCAQNRAGLLPYVTRALREHGLTVARADIATEGEEMKNVFYVQDMSGNKVDMGSVEMLRRELEPLPFQVKNELKPMTLNSMGKDGFSFAGLLRSQLEKLSPSFVSS